MSNENQKSGRLGRPRKPDPIVQNVNVAMPGSLIAFLDKEAERTGKSRSEIVRYLILAGMGVESGREDDGAWTYRLVGEIVDRLPETDGG